ncbi:methylated-DNA--[protein]-cysteine S-methyltransferase [Lutispora thermophila]|uniref:Methylated-DNA--protein-cysteine methyltransferase n=1 Tax=Lutispora thermophila DSM 19022 TaxID=1122184 RepID=A0A1M6FX18_9FIRM|nr:methylated-DNA--[protein]-cysteine S-methyltransferase [Lutispora thermophila]SHJ02202.1 methylated-DNA-[protein]-cysteine S-methyltransferase [Lutispora thermophila DSM 19022]
MYTSCMDSPIGRICLKSSGKGLMAMNFNKDEESPCECEEKEDEYIIQAKKELEEYFEGRLKTFTVKLDLQGTEFQKKVWNELLKIPYGELRTYAEIAESLGGKKYSRAVGTANKANPVPIIVPCHRVIRTGRMISNYSGGLDVQRKLFEIEGIEYRDIKYLR